MKFTLSLFIILFFANCINAQMLSKETGQPFQRNARIKQQKTQVILPSAKFNATSNNIKIENATPVTGSNCNMEATGIMEYVMQYDSTRALMMYQHANPAFTGCPTGVTFIMDIDKLFTQKRVIDPNLINIKKKLIRRNMQRN